MSEQANNAEVISFEIASKKIKKKLSCPVKSKCSAEIITFPKYNKRAGTVG